MTALDVYRNYKGPEVVTDERGDKFYLDLKCPHCGRTNRIGTLCPQEGKPCKRCGTVIDFWAAWSFVTALEYYDELEREFWSSVM